MQLHTGDISEQHQDKHPDLTILSDRELFGKSFMLQGSNCSAIGSPVRVVQYEAWTTLRSLLHTSSEALLVPKCSGEFHVNRHFQSSCHEQFVGQTFISDLQSVHLPTGSQPNQHFYLSGVRQPVLDWARRVHDDDKVTTDFIDTVRCSQHVLVIGKNSEAVVGSSSIGYRGYGWETSFWCLKPSSLLQKTTTQDVEPSKTGLHIFFNFNPNTPFSGIQA